MWISISKNLLNLSVDVEIRSLEISKFYIPYFKIRINNFRVEFLLLVVIVVFETKVGKCSEFVSERSPYECLTL